ncbi:hypothetical protein CORC01_00863 [Colletotrichum orchidophilum]|uniref:Uncharacterized protein n=1 Tax=Colletotrichum orchidophilum TaxID=1209926 RepID=A0A1G4BRG1_9PEZI|nr:uncharacterized protein CORC01_00863 [Colletotrichum orchidophilum]OHF04001.1 hypothetical protein CORC01_00863 [Colletotrichum orchidophilum]
MTDDEERAFSRLYPTVRQELCERPGVYLFQEGSNIVIELEENITIPQQVFIRIVAEYKRLKTRRNGNRHPTSSASRFSTANSQNDAT